MSKACCTVAAEAGDSVVWNFTVPSSVVSEVASMLLCRYWMSVVDLTAGASSAVWRA